MKRSELAENNKLGELIKEYRYDHDISLDELAKKVGCSKQYLNFLERGVNPVSHKALTPSLKMLSKIAKTLEIPLDELVSFIRIVEYDHAGNRYYRYYIKADE